VNDTRAMVAGALAGAVIGAAVAYLFFTAGGKDARSRLEPAVEDFRREFARFRKTISKVGDVAAEGMRVVNEFNAARAQSMFDRGTSH